MFFGIIPILILLVFGAGIALAGQFCKTPVAQFFVGILLGFGFLSSWGWLLQAAWCYCRQAASNDLG